MVTRIVDRTGPEWVTVQMQVRAPYWRKEQLNAEARVLGINLPTLIADALDRVYPPKPPS